MAWATRAGLGKARWQASDGGAWRGAAEAAVTVLTGMAPLDPPTLAALLDYLGPEDDAWVVAYATHQMHRLVDSCGDASGGIRLSELDLSVRDGLWLWDSLRVAAITDAPCTDEARAQSARIGLARDQVARLHLLAPWCRVADEAGERLRAGDVVVEHAAGDHETSVVLRLGEEQWVVDRWEAAERLFGVAAAAAW